ncbi:hypothetical protein B0H13DRAFT_1897864 [Mycena leptocephala]|nr:hypothetical protein B0H13DRAFT_1897864 [Mycena leptocephala]
MDPEGSLTLGRKKSVRKMRQLPQTCTKIEAEADLNGNEFSARPETVRNGSRRFINAWKDEISKKNASVASLEKKTCTKFEAEADLNGNEFSARLETVRNGFKRFVNAWKDEISKKNASVASLEKKTLTKIKGKGNLNGNEFSETRTKLEGKAGSNGNEFLVRAETLTNGSRHARNCESGVRVQGARRVSSCEDEFAILRSDKSANFGISVMPDGKMYGAQYLLFAWIEYWRTPLIILLHDQYTLKQRIWTQKHDLHLQRRKWHRGWSVHVLGGFGRFFDLGDSSCVQDSLWVHFGWPLARCSRRGAPPLRSLLILSLVNQAIGYKLMRSSTVPGLPSVNPDFKITTRSWITKCAVIAVI